MEYSFAEVSFSCFFSIFEFVIFRLKKLETIKQIKKLISTPKTCQRSRKIQEGMYLPLSYEIFDKFLD